MIAVQCGKLLSIGAEIDFTLVCAEGNISTELYRLVANEMTGLVNIVDLQFPSTRIEGV